MNDILENPKHLKKMAKSLDSLIKDTPDCHHFVTCLMDKKEMRMERIIISGRAKYFLTPTSCPFSSRKYPYTDEIQHVRKHGSPHAVYKLDELIEMMEKRNFEIK